MQQTCLGIDIAKESFVAAYPTPKGKLVTRSFTNDHKGFEALAELVDNQFDIPVHVCMESTGGYEFALARFLHERGQSVSVVNPRQIKDFADCLNVRNKTDKYDAKIIQQFAASMKPRTWQPPSDEGLELQQLSRRRQTLSKNLQKEQCRLAGPMVTEVVRELIKENIAHLQRQMDKVERLIRDLIARDESLREQVELLDSIKGIGEKTAITVLGEIAGDIGRFESARQFAAWAGTTPTTRQSGSSVRGQSKMSKMGSPAIRYALYMPAIAAIRSNPAVRALVERMKKKKPSRANMELVGAAMRKLLHQMYGVLKHRKPFDPTVALAA